MLEKYLILFIERVVSNASITDRTQLLSNIIVLRIMVHLCYVFNMLIVFGELCMENIYKQSLTLNKHVFFYFKVTAQNHLLSGIS